MTAERRQAAAVELCAACWRHRGADDAHEDVRAVFELDRAARAWGLVSPTPRAALLTMRDAE